MRLSQWLSAPAVMERCPAALQMPLLHQGEKGERLFSRRAHPPPAYLTLSLVALADVDINHHGGHDEISNVH